MSAPDRIWVGFEDGREYAPVFRSENSAVSHGWDGDAAVATKYVRADLAPGWRDISTAPKDGTWFWGATEHDAIHMCWREGFDAFVSTWREMTFAKNYGGGTTEHSPTIQYPTHWMPAITPPVQSYETCAHCDGSGMALRDDGDPGLCQMCNGDTQIPVQS